MAANQGIGKKTMLLSAIVDEVSRAPLSLHSVRLHFCSQALLFMKEQPTLAGVTFFNSGFHYIIDSLFQWRYCILQGWFPRNLPKFMAALLSQSLLSPSIPHTYFAAPQLSQPILYCTAPSLFSSSSPKQQLQHNIAA